MPNLLFFLMASLWMAAALPAEPRANVETVASSQPDSRQLERALQRLPWNQFKWVVESIPKLKADVDAYGPLGWEYVKSHYRTHAWRRSIDKLKPDQKQHLAELIQKARTRP